jgi:hypothetical protein
MAKFSKSHYQLIAKVFHNEYAQSGTNGTERTLIFVLAEALAQELRHDNPAFNYEHFLAVVKGEAEVDSKPPHSTFNSRCRVSNCHKVTYAEGYCDVHWKAKHGI